MAVPWRIMAARIDGAVDNVFGEPVILIPRVPGGISSDGGPDLTRGGPAQTVGVFREGDSTVGGEGGTGSGAFNGRAEQANVWLSITEDNLVVDLKKDDLVDFPDREESYIVTYVSPSGTARPDVYLIPYPGGYP